MIRELDFLDLPLLVGNLESTAQWLVSEAAAQRNRPPLLISHINLHNYYLLCGDEGLRSQIVGECRLLFDGIGLKLGALAMGRGWLDDINGTDLYPLVFDRIERARIPAFFLGGTAEVKAKAIACIQSRWPSLAVAGHRSGYFRPDDEPAVAAEIRASGARLLVNSRGFPRQEEFAIRNRNDLGVSVVWNVGGLFDFISETKPRAPLSMRRLRLEWLYRLWLEPQRMWPRTVIEPPWLVAQVIRHRAWSVRIS